ncbi:exosortase A [Parahaliea sp. F7430]|uniref:Exosortase A n=1 Tax=Sediminihaliea albiluteola TaxID=2758564 RepID=A0A7W2TVG1_9GAMM|nr:exosortase A [Sediminihaliea albiluteola]MBA6412707.1 exosortase A [Sediminihaliea albiluteola]
MTTNVPSSLSSTATVNGWGLASILVALYWCAVFIMFAETALSIQAIWARSDTFAHGYLILPISIWLVYRKKEELRLCRPQGSFLAVLFLVPSLLLWLAASLVQVLVVQQLALVAMLVAGTWAILGNSVARIIVFPLGFLFLAVPMGLGLIPPMQEFTATATVRMVEWSGVPVFRDGMYFSLPTGNWRVVEACSGVRYLIASFTLGVLYAYLSYSRLWKQLLFIALSLFVPILANALRAYFIVMLGHLSSGKLAAGVDHLVYGWVFFGLVMLLLFWIGSFWAEAVSNDSPSLRASTEARGPRSFKLLGAFLASVALLWSGQSLFKQIGLNTAELQAQAMTVPPASTKDWQQSDAATPWLPLEAGAQRVTEQAYTQGEQQLFLVLQLHYGGQIAGAEAIIDFKRLLGNQGQWRVISSGRRQLSLNDRKFTLIESHIDSGTQRLKVWYWFKVGPHVTANHYMAKLFELWQQLREGQSQSERVLLFSVDALERDSGADMEHFLQQHQWLVGQHVR